MSRRALHAPQLVSSLGQGNRLLMLSCCRELERGARAALLHAPRLFRLDTIAEGDTLRTVVRNLSSGALEVAGGHHNEPGSLVVCGGAAAFEPARASVGLSIRTAAEQVDVEVTIATLLLAEHGVMRVAGQAILRISAA